MARSTPWGASDSTKSIIRGVSIVSTASHGGIMVSAGFAEKNMSPEALERGMKYGNYYCYEEDDAYCIAAFEIKELFDAFVENSKKTADEMGESLLKNLSLHHADYLLDKGIEPSEKEYQQYKDRITAQEMRDKNHPDLIVSASGSWKTLMDDVCKVTTADGESHYVKGYKKEGGLLLLSNFEKIDELPDLLERFPEYLLSSMNKTRELWSDENLTSEELGNKLGKRLQNLVEDFTSELKKEGESSKTIRAAVITQINNFRKENHENFQEVSLDTMRDIINEVAPTVTEPEATRTLTV